MSSILSSVSCPIYAVEQLSCYSGGFRDCCETLPCGLVSGRRTTSSTCHCDKSCYDKGDCCEDIGETCQGKSAW